MTRLLPSSTFFPYTTLFRSNQALYYFSHPLDKFMEKILVTDPKDLDKMRAACQAAAQTLDYLEQFIKPGVTTAEIDRLCLEYITDRKSTRLNSSHVAISYAVFCLKKKQH